MPILNHFIQKTTGGAGTTAAKGDAAMPDVAIQKNVKAVGARQLSASSSSETMNSVDNHECLGGQAEPMPTPQQAYLNARRLEQIRRAQNQMLQSI